MYLGTVILGFIVTERKQTYFIYLYKLCNKQN